MRACSQSTREQLTSAPDEEALIGHHLLLFFPLLAALLEEMRSYSWQIKMDNNQGDLGDIVRAIGCGVASSAGQRVFDAAWQLPPELASFPPLVAGSHDDFGDPFSGFKDPLLNELASARLSDSPDSAAGLVEMITVGSSGDGAMAGAGGSGGSLVSQKVVLGNEMKRPCSMFSKASSMVSPREIIRPSAVFKGGMVQVNNSLAGRSLDEGGLHIPSTRIPGVKRRKGQAKKVVCIPAPAAASSRPGGEMVPSDLWAWRKYGQKPIKGSPYPRGYYRCSSSKGCSARKQVERSRTDPNMLVITYTSEHNHPWPTQRNALAGSTRSSQPAAKNSSSAPKSSRHKPRSPASSRKEESQETATMAGPADVKEEAWEVEKPVDIGVGEHELDQLFHQSYEPVPPKPVDPWVDDLFAGLVELEGDPTSLVFSKPCVGDKLPGGERESKAVDPFSIFDWLGNSLGEARKGGL